MSTTNALFPTIYGRNLVGELRHFVHRPYLVVTMEDLWQKFEPAFDKQLAGVHLVHTLEEQELEATLSQQLAELPGCNSVIGLGGGQGTSIATAAMRAASSISSRPSASNTERFISKHPRAPLSRLWGSGA